MLMKLSLILEKVNVKPEDRSVVMPAREYAEKLKSQNDTQILSSSCYAS